MKLRGKFRRIGARSLRVAFAHAERLADMKENYKGYLRNDLVTGRRWASGPKRAVIPRLASSSRRRFVQGAEPAPARHLRATAGRPPAHPAEAPRAKYRPAQWLLAIPSDCR